MKMGSSLKRNLLLLEINELPWEVIDKFADHPKLVNIKKFFQEAKTYTTYHDQYGLPPDDSKLVKGISKEGKEVIIDSGELSPWVTWPTLHRGINSNEHGIRFLGQDPNTFKGKPIWIDFLERGESIGICGSLQSWPPIYPGENGFYIPDCFSQDERCYPKFVEQFQRFNLEQVQKNGLVIRERSLFSSSVIPLIFTLPKFVSFNSFCEVAKQLFLEILDKAYLSRRPSFQCILFWDLFKKLYDVDKPPAFSTFFTNHVASLLHRYWHHIFPEDFGDLYSNLKKDYLPTILYALKVVDKIIGNALRFTQINPSITLAFATSMGQEAIRYVEYEGYSLELEDISKLLDFFEIRQGAYKPLLAMVPQCAISVEDKITKDQISKCLRNCFSVSGRRLFALEEAGNTLSITIHTPPKSDILSKKFIYKKSTGEDIFLDFSSYGIIVHELEEATGYHKKEGILAFYGKNINADDSREKIKLTEVKNILLDLAFTEKPLVFAG